LPYHQVQLIASNLNRYPAYFKTIALLSWLAISFGTTASIHESSRVESSQWFVLGVLHVAYSSMLLIIRVERKNTTTSTYESSHLDHLVRSCRLGFTRTTHT
jgi:hypothetical protein